MLCGHLYCCRAIIVIPLPPSLRFGRQVGASARRVYEMRVRLKNAVRRIIMPPLPPSLKLRRTRRGLLFQTCNKSSSSIIISPLRGWQYKIRIVLLLIIRSEMIVSSCLPAEAFLLHQRLQRIRSEGGSSCQADFTGLMKDYQAAYRRVTRPTPSGLEISR